MEIKTNTSYVKNIKCADAYTESRADYSLPDYLGDMRKILFTEASLRPSGRFAGGDEVEFSGIVVYKVIYLDTDGKICSAEFSSDYDYSVKCSGENYKESTSETRISNYAVRLIGPRRISASASLVGCVRISQNESIEISGDALSFDNTAEVSAKRIEIRHTGLSNTVEREYAEQIARLDGAIADEVSVIYCSAEPWVESVELSGDVVCVKGRLCILGVVQNGENPAQSYEKTITYEENLDFEDADDYIKLIPEVMVTSLKPGVNATEDGCEVVMSVILESYAVGEGNSSVEIITDGYLKTSETENRYDNMTFSRLVGASSVKGVHNAEFDRSEIESDSISEIVFLTATPKIERVEMTDDGVSLFGEIRYSGIASDTTDGKISYVSLKFTSPFATNVNIDCQNCSNLHPEARVLARGASASLDGSKLYASCVLESYATVCSEDSERILTSSVKLDCEVMRNAESSVVVYYPDQGDTLFSVAKRFRSSSIKIAKDNGITENVFSSDNPQGSLSGIKKLLIY